MATPKEGLKFNKLKDLLVRINDYIFRDFSFSNENILNLT